MCKTRIEILDALSWLDEQRNIEIKTVSVSEGFNKGGCWRFRRVWDGLTVYGDCASTMICRAAEAAKEKGRT